MDEASVIISSFIAADEPRDESLRLSLQELSGDAFSATICVGPADAEAPVLFQIFFDQTWTPLFIMSDSSKLAEWVLIIGRTLESTPEAQTLGGLLPRIAKSLAAHLAPPTPSKAVEEVEESTYTPEQVEREIRQWSRSHPRMRLALNRVDRDDHLALFSLGHIKFQLYFKSNWNPLFFSTENAELNQHLQMANMLLSTQGFLKKTPIASKPAVASEPAVEKPVEEKKIEEVVESSNAMSVDPPADPSGEKKEEDATEKKEEEATEKTEEAATEEEVQKIASVPVPAAPVVVEEIGLARIFDLIMEGYKSQFDFDLEGDDLDDEDDAEEDETGENGEVGVQAPEEPVEPTEEEWANKVLPGVRRYMRREAMAPYLMDEWVRRLEQAKKNQSVGRALAMIRDELISGSAIPASLRPFIPRRAYGFHSFDSPSFDANHRSNNSSEDVKAFLSAQWSKLSRRILPETGFYARPLKGDTLHWTVELFGFDSNSPLGVTLMQLALQHHKFDEKSTAPAALAPQTDEDGESDDSASAPSLSTYYKPQKKVEAVNIVIEILFPDTFDDESLPFFRVIRPTLVDLPEDFFENVFKTFKPKPKPVTPAPTTSSSAPKPTDSTEGVIDLAQSTSSSGADVPTLTSYYADLATSAGSGGGASVPSVGDSIPVVGASQETAADSSTQSTDTTATGAVSESESEKKKSAWNKDSFDLFDFISDLRLCLMTQQPKVDMNSALTGYQTTGFWKRFRCISAVMAEEDKIEGTGKVCLPASCLELIYGNRASMHLSASGNFAPMTFELCGIESKVQTYCGVLEFTAQEGTVVVPSWMFQMLHFQEGETVMLRQISLPPGDFVKLQPLTDSHQVEGINPKTLLEWHLRSFVALVKGEILPIFAHGHTFKFSVLDVRPGHAIAITDRDITVEFVDPLESTESSSSSPSKNPPGGFAPHHGVNSPMVPASAAPAAKSPLRTGHMDADSGEVVDGKKCDNCRHVIPHAAYLTHSMRCPRMNYFCEGCQVAVPKADKENHDATVHAPAECGRCHEKMEVRHMAHHAQNTCKARIVQCAYCELNMPAESKDSHEQACGARTVKCQDCNVRVAVRFLEEHRASGCVKKEEPRRYGSPGGRNGGSTSTSSYSGAGPATGLFVCETCKAPIESFDELQVHMLTVHYEDSAVAEAVNAMDITPPAAAEESAKPAEE